MLDPSVLSDPPGSDEVYVAYRQLGSGPPLILVPGVNASMATWSPSFLQALARRFRLTIFDPPGIGYSSAAATGLSVDWLADVVAGLCSSLRVSHALVLGWGLGGQVALALAERHPQLVGGLLLADTGLPLGHSRPPFGRSAARLGSAKATPDEIAGVLFPAGALIARQQWLTAQTGEVPDVVTAAGLGSEAALERSFWRRTDVVARLGTIKLPGLSFSGRPRTQLSDARVEALPRSGGGLWRRDATPIVFAPAAHTALQLTGRLSERFGRTRRG
jgi:pimeloyl-ACP methyl ester carboxylesterase